jgi:Na+/proline symporter
MIYLACVLAYLLFLGGIGIYKSRGVSNQEDFAVAGRSLSPWVMVCTMLAVWIGTGSIVGNAEKTYDTGMAALLLPTGTVIGMILLMLIARKARNIEANSVPEIIGNRFGGLARNLSVFALIVAYMVIVSYQFNAGGAVLEVITGYKPAVELGIGDELTAKQLYRGRVVFTPEEEWSGETSLQLAPGEDADAETEGAFDVTLRVVPPTEIIEEQEKLEDDEDAATTALMKTDCLGRLRLKKDFLDGQDYTLVVLPEHGKVQLIEPYLTAQQATLIAAIFIIIYTAMAGLMSLAYMDVATGIIITVSMILTLPIYYVMAGGFSGMETAFAGMGDRPDHMTFWGVYTPVKMINYCLPVFLLVLGDANQYQRIFASKNAKGARSAVFSMIFIAYAIELLIIACAWAAASMTPDPDNGKYILIYSARHYLPTALGCLFMVTVVGIIVSTADSFLLVPATTFINDIYLHYINPEMGRAIEAEKVKKREAHEKGDAAELELLAEQAATDPARKKAEKKIVFISRLLVVIFGAIAYGVTLMFSETTGFFDKALYAFTIYGASITPALVAAIVWKKATKAGAVSSIMSGIVISLVWSELASREMLGFLPGDWAGLDAVLPAILISVSCLIGISLLTQPGPVPPKDEADA